MRRNLFMSALALLFVLVSAFFFLYLSTRNDFEIRQDRIDRRRTEVKNALARRADIFEELGRASESNSELGDATQEVCALLRDASSLTEEAESEKASLDLRDSYALSGGDEELREKIEKLDSLHDDIVRSMRRHDDAVEKWNEELDKIPARFFVKMLELEPQVSYAEAVGAGEDEASSETSETDEPAEQEEVDESEETEDGAEF